MKKKIVFGILFLIIMCVSTVIYAKYIIADQMLININTLPFYFFANVDKTDIEFDGNEAFLNLEISNNNGEAYTYSDIQYEIILESNIYQFFIENENVENNKLSKILAGNSLNNVLYNLKFSVKDETMISLTENCILKIKAQSPYVQEIAIPLAITLTPGNVEVSIDNLTGTLENSNSSSTHILTVKNNNSIPITYNIEGNSTTDLKLSGVNESIIVPAHSEVSKEVTITPAKTVYSSEKSSIEIKVNIITPYKNELENYTIEIDLFGSSIQDIITQRYTVNTETPNFKENITTQDGSGLFQTQDAKGTAQYFRGVISDNYVSFANHLWRIMRINSDGTMRLILDSPLASSSFTTATNNTVYNDGPAEKIIEEWYKEHLLSYNSYIHQNILFIHDRRVASTNSEVYQGWERIFKGTPTINTSGLSYSQKYSINTMGNGFLAYPIALPTAEEIMMAGATIAPDANITNPNSSETMPNSSFYMATDIPNESGLWTMTPFSATDVLCFKLQFGINKENPTNTLLLKPVIELNANLKFIGNGTKANPFIISE